MYCHCGGKRKIILPVDHRGDIYFRTTSKKKRGKDFPVSLSKSSFFKISSTRDLKVKILVVFKLHPKLRNPQTGTFGKQIRKREVTLKLDRNQNIIKNSDSDGRYDDDMCINIKIGDNEFSETGKESEMEFVTKLKVKKREVTMKLKKSQNNVGSSDSGEKHDIDIY
ncbi:hypothetical protein AVEN_126875-1 [Araneus ventricosus]|uniref:Uncharacterized protein n=1 Tax=Araneus ventricosus TaxID=182803 RepID=A0A4Y2C2W7_ARAVE|nr:hypothetical protein AVEN_126875-1 [Araneus ventricosus]